MKHLRKAVWLALSLVLLLCSCGGTKMGGDTLLQIGEERFTRQEAAVFLLSQHSIYAGEYGEDIWKVQLSDGSFESYVRKAMLDYLERLFLVDCAAREEGISLSTTEKAAVEKAADAFFRDLNEETITKTGLTREICEQAYTRFARAQIFYRQVLGRGMDEISDEEARAVKILIVSVAKDLGIETAQALLAKIKAGTSAIEATKNKEGMTIRQETIVRGTYSDSFDTLVFALKKEQWSPVITLQNDYVLVQCLSVYEEEATAVNKAVMEKENRERQLEEAMTAYGSKITLVMNPAAWEDVSMSSLQGLSPANFYDYTAGLVVNY